MKTNDIFAGIVISGGNMYTHTSLSLMTLILYMVAPSYNVAPVLQHILGCFSLAHILFIILADFSNRHRFSKLLMFLAQFFGSIIY